MITKKEMQAFENFVESQTLKNDERCKHNTFIGDECKSCEREMMEDFVLFNLESMDESEIAQAIQEGVVTLDQVKTKMRVNAVWQD